jgi:Arc/MetJ family transcription regulator
MRTTIELNDDVVRAVKRRAAEEKKAFRDVVEEALRAYLTPPKARRAYRLQWRTERGVLRPGVDLDSRNALWNVMEGRR